MTTSGIGDVYASLGVRPVINARGNQTILGGSKPSERVRAAMAKAGRSFVVMEELLAKSGEHIADLLGTEAAYVTSGCSAALALSAAACIAGSDPDKIFQLPDTTGLKDEVILQKKQRYSYDRSYTVTGAKLVEAGDDDGCTAEQLEEAMGPNTAAVAYFIQPDWDDSVVSLEDAVEIAHGRGVPVIADAASQIYPLDYFRSNAQSADLVCFGAKYLEAPHSTGFVCGRKDLVEAVAASGFIGFHTGGRRAIGRPMKVDRQDVIGVVAALDAWFSTNHEDRLLAIDETLSGMRRGLVGLDGVEPTVERHNRFWGATLNVVVDPEATGKSAEQVARELEQGSPPILVAVEGEALAINAHTLNEGEDRVVVERLREVLSD